MHACIHTYMNAYIRPYIHTSRSSAARIPLYSVPKSARKWRCDMCHMSVRVSWPSGNDTYCPPLCRRNLRPTSSMTCSPGLSRWLHILTILYDWRACCACCACCACTCVCVRAPVWYITTHAGLRANTEQVCQECGVVSIEAGARTWACTSCGEYVLCDACYTRMGQGDALHCGHPLSERCFSSESKPGDSMATSAVGLDDSFKSVCEWTVAAAAEIVPYDDLKGAAILQVQTRPRSFSFANVSKRTHTHTL